MSKSDLAALQRKLAVQLSLLRNAIADNKKLGDRKDEIFDEIERLSRASDLLLNIAVVYQQEVTQFVSDVVTVGIQDIFESDWVVLFEESNRGSQKVIDILLYQGEEPVSVPEGCGGGVTQAIAVLMQLCVVYLLRSEVLQTVVLDESLSHLADVYVPNAASTLKSVADRLGIQLIIVTHQELLTEPADILYEFNEGGDITCIQRHIN